MHGELTLAAQTRRADAAPLRHGELTLRRSDTAS